LRGLFASSVALVISVNAPDARACGADMAGARKLESDRYVLVYRTQPAELAVGAHFSVELLLCAKDGATAPESVQVDAHMPEHRHGMNYRAVVKAQGNGRYRADGLMFHMPGRWEYAFALRGRERTDRLTHSIVLADIGSFCASFS
jgi:hypothetical protein